MVHDEHDFIMMPKREFVAVCLNRLSLSDDRFHHWDNYFDLSRSYLTDNRFK